jgi:hypothetical protein
LRPEYLPPPACAPSPLHSGLFLPPPHRRRRVPSHGSPRGSVLKGCRNSLTSSIGPHRQPLIAASRPSPAASCLSPGPTPASGDGCFG